MRVPKLPATLLRAPVTVGQPLRLQAGVVVELRTDAEVIAGDRVSYPTIYAFLQQSGADVVALGYPFNKLTPAVVRLTTGYLAFQSSVGTNNVWVSEVEDGGPPGGCGCAKCSKSAH